MSAAQFELDDAARSLDMEQIAYSRELIARARELLKDSGPHTFLGNPVSRASASGLAWTGLVGKKGARRDDKRRGRVDRDLARAHLAATERHVAEGQLHVERQARLVTDLERATYDATDALAILTTMQRTQRLHIEDRERILSELED